MGNIDLSNISIANIQTISGMTMPEILQQMKSLGIGISGENYTIRDYTGIITGNIVTGGTVSMGGYDWIVTAIMPSERIFYMACTVCTSKVKYGSTHVYSTSTLAQTAKDFAASLPSNVQDVLLSIASGGVTQKCHAPTYAQITTWFSSNSDLQLKYEGAATSWWLIDQGLDSGFGTSIPKDNTAMYVNTSGTIQTGGWMSNTEPASVSTTYGFRPVVALMM